jgi:DNA polymerase I-like protein with 3'-5' exonuclease and polymerase domains
VLHLESERAEVGELAAVHDEVVVECDQDQAQAVAEWLKRAMIDAMAPLIDPIPCEIEVKVGPTWGT